MERDSSTIGDSAEEQWRPAKVDRTGKQCQAQTQGVSELVAVADSARHATGKDSLPLTGSLWQEVKPLVQYWISFRVKKVQHF